MTLRYTFAVTLTFASHPLVKPQITNSDESDSVGLQIMIWSANESQARKLDDALKPLLIEYGYDPLAGRAEFSGSFFVRYRYSNKTAEIEKDFELFFGSDPRHPATPAAKLPSNNVEKWKKLKEVLEKTFTILTLGTVLVANLGAIYELSEQVHKTFGHKPTLSKPAPHTKKQLLTIPLQASLVSIDAEKKPHQFERMLNSDVQKFVASRGLLKKKKSRTDVHLDSSI